MTDIPFIQRIPGKSGFVVREDCLQQLLQPVRTPKKGDLKEMRNLDVAILCIMGPSRSGKSFFLNFVRLYLDYMEKRGARGVPSSNSEIPEWIKSGGERISGFDVKGGTVAVTQGIHFWSKPYILRRNNGKKMCLLLMDTQGLWDDQMENDFNCCIFGLSCVLSSYVLFNQKKNINSMELKRLAGLSMLSKEMVSEGRKMTFQRLDILLRDYEGFSLRKDTIETSEEKRKQRLIQLQTKVAEMESFEALKSCFDMVEVMCSFDPGDEVREVDYQGTISDISPKFLQLMSRYIEGIVNTIEPLKVGGRSMKCEEFAKFATEEANRFAEWKNYPDLDDSLDSTYAGMMTALVEEANQKFIDDLFLLGDGVCVESFFSDDGKVRDESLTCLVNAIRTDYLPGFDKSSEIPLSKRLQKAKEIGLKYFKEKAKGSMNLRREYELILTNKMEKKAKYRRTIQEKTHIPNQEMASFEYQHKRARDQAIESIKREIEGLEKICIYYTGTDNKTWRTYYNMINMMTNELNQQYERYKGIYESYMKIHGHSMVLRGNEELDSRDKYLSSLTVASGSKNSASRFELEGYNYLKEIIIGDNCFTSVTHFKLDGLIRLEKLVVGKKSFTNGEYENKYYNTDRSFTVTNCPVLSLIDICECSFAEFGGEWKLSGLDRLEKLRIVSEEETSYNFNGSPFVIEGLSHLREIELGFNAFVWTAEIRLENLENLERIEMNKWALQGDTKEERNCSLVLKDLPQLQTIRAKSIGNITQPRKVIIRNVPMVSNVDLYDPFRECKSEDIYNVGLGLRSYFLMRKLKADMAEFLNVDSAGYVSGNAEDALNSCKEKHRNYDITCHSGLDVMRFYKGLLGDYRNAMKMEMGRLDSYITEVNRDIEKNDNGQAVAAGGTLGGVVGALFFPPLLLVTAASSAAGKQLQNKERELRNRKERYQQKYNKQSELIKTIESIERKYNLSRVWIVC